MRYSILATRIAFCVAAVDQNIGAAILPLPLSSGLAVQSGVNRIENVANRSPNPLDRGDGYQQNQRQHQRVLDQVLALVI